MNERLLTGLRIEQSGQNKIRVVRLEDLLGGPKLTFELCELLDTCDEDISRSPFDFAGGRSLILSHETQK